MFRLINYESYNQGITLDTVSKVNICLSRVFYRFFKDFLPVDGYLLGCLVTSYEDLLFIVIVRKMLAFSHIK